MYIFQDVKTGDVVIDSHRFKGFIEREKNCVTCEGYTVYVEEARSYFCPCCNEWATESRKSITEKPLKMLCTAAK